MPNKSHQQSPDFELFLQPIQNQQSSGLHNDIKVRHPAQPVMHHKSYAYLGQHKQNRNIKFQNSLIHEKTQKQNIYRKDPFVAKNLSRVKTEGSQTYQSGKYSYLTAGFKIEHRKCKHENHAQEQGPSFPQNLQSTAGMTKVFHQADNCFFQFRPSNTKTQTKGKIKSEFLTKCRKVNPAFSSKQKNQNKQEMRESQLGQLGESQLGQLGLNHTDLHAKKGKTDGRKPTYLQKKNSHSRISFNNRHSQTSDDRKANRQKLAQRFTVVRNTFQRQVNCIPRKVALRKEFLYQKKVVMTQNDCDELQAVSQIRFNNLKERRQKQLDWAVPGSSKISHKKVLDRPQIGCQLNNKCEEEENRPFCPKNGISAGMDKSGEATSIKNKKINYRKKDSFSFVSGNRDLDQKNCEPSRSQIDWKNQLMINTKIGEGTFGKVYKAKLPSSSSQFAVKKVPIDKKYKSRELQIVKILQHPNIMKVHAVFVTTSNDQQFLNIVMDEYPLNLYEVITQQQDHPQSVLRRKVHLYQIFKGLSYMHSLSICHRDIKPHNMLVDNWSLALCDFGSAKKLVQSQSNLSYICSRCYRAPELIFGSTNYTTQIDIWSVGCIILEMLNKIPLFIGENSLDHLLQVIKVLGTPSKTEVLAMNKDYDLTDYQLPYIKRKDLSKLFLTADSQLLDLVGKLLSYSPQRRPTAVQALLHPYFHELRDRAVIQRISRQVDTSSWFSFGQKQLHGLNSSETKALITNWHRSDK